MITTQKINVKNSINPIGIINSSWQYRDLILQFIKRDIIGRYRGSYLGVIWSFLNPLLMLFIYTFVFSVIFKAKWGIQSNSKIEFALILFSGITTFNIFSEVLNKAPSLIIANSNYVKKVIFPLEIFPIVALGSALIHSAISYIILIIGLVLLLGPIKWTIICLPLVLLPLILLTLGLSWLFASLGTYFRDIGYVLGIGVQALMFLSPIFYPISAIPEKLKWLYYFNPISYVVEDIRNVLIWGQLPNWGWLGVGTLLGFVITVLGYIWFQKTRGGFADIL